MLRFSPILQVSSQQRTEAKAARSSTATPKSIPHKELQGSRPGQIKRDTPQALQEGSPSNSHKNSFDEQQGILKAVVAENQQIEARDSYSSKKLATCSVAVQTEKQGCSRCGYKEGEPKKDGESTEDLQHIGPAIELSTNMELVSKVNSIMDVEAESNVNHKVLKEGEDINCLKDLQVKMENCVDTQVGSIVSGDCSQDLARTSESEFMRSIDLQVESKSDDDMDSSMTISPCVIQTRSRTAKNVQK